jgi:hypothetical protein
MSILWYRSYTHADVVVLLAPLDFMQGGVSADGCIQWVFSDARAGRPWSLIHSSVKEAAPISTPWTARDRPGIIRNSPAGALCSLSIEPIVPNRFGFGFARVKPESSGIPGAGGVVITVPHWLLILSASIWPATRAVRGAQGSLRSRRGFCPTCGYDLRATPDRCPECGELTRSVVQGKSI